jgi:hypothetical protein
MIELEKKLRMYRKNVMMMGLFMCATAGLLLLCLVGMFNTYDVLLKEENLTNPSIPNDEMENATYTYSNDWFESHILNLSIGIGILGAVALVGYCLILMGVGLTSNAYLHDCFCTDMDTTYCPDCGIEMTEVRRYRLQKEKERLRKNR